MPKPRVIALFAATALFAVGLSFGASLAVGDPPAPHYTPAGVCLLEPGD
jgi:hypothetical protein